MKKRLFIILYFISIVGCKNDHQRDIEFSSDEINNIIHEMTEVMVNDITNPPLAARFFSYACLAGYEVVAQNNESIKGFYKTLNQYPSIEKPFTDEKSYSYQLSALLAMLETAKMLQPSAKLLEEYESQLLKKCKEKGLKNEVILNSKEYAANISKHIVEYAKADGYNKISNYPRYTPIEKEGSWYPTPPGFFAPVEPYFNTLRPFTLKKQDQFKPQAPVPFSVDKGSEFYHLMEDCYNIGNGLTREQREIASFWDCNPFALQENGHVLIGIKKISPGAHWMGIAGIACSNEKLPFSEAMKVHTFVALALFDTFIACWDEKFRSNRIRPETAIRNLLDKSWKPLLQTPPFPEYLSGHSAISSASAVVLTHFFGEDYEFVDTIEEKYNLKPRKFKSFQEAAIEAGISRVYGGIHFMDAVDNGRLQGLQIGDWIIDNLEGKEQAYSMK